MPNIFDNLLKQSRNQKLAHAYLLMGTFELDKVEELAAMLKIKLPDRLIFLESPVKIGQVRELLHWIGLKPHSSPFKLAVITKADEMTLEAANALLKILEEPPPSSILILQAKKNARILPTILSRCQCLTDFSETLSIKIDGYMSPDELGGKTIKLKFEYAARLAESENLIPVMNAWEKYFRDALLSGKDSSQTLAEIFRIRDLLLGNASVKLLLENLLLSF